jgi:hypothetical protein
MSTSEITATKEPLSIVTGFTVLTEPYSEDSSGVRVVDSSPNGWTSSSAASVVGSGADVDSDVSVVTSGVGVPSGIDVASGVPSVVVGTDVVASADVVGVDVVSSAVPSDVVGADVVTSVVTSVAP